MQRFPLSPPLPCSFAIPDSDHNPAGVNQSVWIDFYIPKSIPSGEYTGRVTILADELSDPVEIAIRIYVNPVAIPDPLSFIIDLNGYGNKWDYGNRETTRLRWFQNLSKTSDVVKYASIWLEWRRDRGSRADAEWIGQRYPRFKTGRDSMTPMARFSMVPRFLRTIRQIPIQDRE